MNPGQPQIPGIMPGANILQNQPFIMRGGIIVRHGDSLRVSSFSSLAGVTLIWVLRIYDQNGLSEPMTINMITDATRTANTVLYPLRDGVLESVSCFWASGSNVVRGQVFVKASIVKAMANPILDVQPIMANYLTTGSPVVYPGSPLISSTDGLGYQYTISAPGLPAATATVSMFANTRWRILGTFAIITTSAVAGNRQLITTIADASGTVFSIVSRYLQAPSLTVSYFGGGLQEYSATAPFGANAQMQYQVPPIIIRYAGSVAYTINNVQAGDVFPSSTGLFIEELLDV